MLVNIFLNQVRRRSFQERPALVPERVAQEAGPDVALLVDLQRGLAMLSPEQRAVTVLRHL